MLIIDEGDCILQIGFEKEMNQILRLLSNKRQTVLFSATMTRKVEDLIRLSVRDPEYLEAEQESGSATVNTLDQQYIVVEEDKKFRLLYDFLDYHQDKDQKIMIFMSTCNAVKVSLYLHSYTHTYIYIYIVLS